MRTHLNSIFFLEYLMYDTFVLSNFKNEHTMKKHLKFGIFLIIYWIGIITILAQDNKLEYQFRKGEVLDILLLTNGPDVKTLFPNYRNTAFPVATKFSYKPIPGLPITETLQGGIQPQSLIFGKWDSKEKRKGFLDAIVPEVPDFHKQRRAIWTYFSLTYYELPRDISFTINRSKYNVVTSYWGEGKSFKEYLKAFQQATTQNGGKEVISLTNGTSPVGYVYNPDYLTITQWESKTAFDAFYKEHLAMEEKRIHNVHQFVLK